MQQFMVSSSVLLPNPFQLYSDMFFSTGVKHKCDLLSSETSFQFMVLCVPPLWFYFVAGGNYVMPSLNMVGTICEPVTFIHSS